tara:strand:- start:306 stop:776 length:471 start_codon:yes stop_codon:yes gene_type:complete
MPGHTQAHSQYRVYGTNEPYNGMTVEIGGYMYSTVGGALEGDSLQLIAAGSNVNTDPNFNPQNQTAIQSPGVQNPVTRTFISRTTYYRQDGTPVPSGAELHQHQDGTIMLGHDPNNMGAIVTSTNPNTTRRTTNTTRRTTNTTMNTRNTRRMSGGY